MAQDLTRVGSYLLRLACIRISLLKSNSRGTIHPPGAVVFCSVLIMCCSRGDGVVLGVDGGRGIGRGIMSIVS